VEVAEVMVTLDPVAVRVAIRVLLVPTGTLPKFKAPALEVNCPAETPVPDNAMPSVGFGAFETTETVPFTSPLAHGVNRTLNVMLCPLLRFRGRVKPRTPKPVPATAACKRVTVEGLEFVNVSNCSRVWPS
jgi:hypothetical protein